MGAVAVLLFFFFNDTATTEIYTLSLHDALPIWATSLGRRTARRSTSPRPIVAPSMLDRKSTRLNSSHSQISYAVFCLKKKNKQPSPLSFATPEMPCPPPIPLPHHALRISRHHPP